jgi:hypothetical protein
LVVSSLVLWNLALVGAMTHSCSNAQRPIT